MSTLSPTRTTGEDADSVGCIPSGHGPAQGGEGGRAAVRYSSPTQTARTTDQSKKEPSQGLLAAFAASEPLSPASTCIDTAFCAVDGLGWPAQWTARARTTKLIGDPQVVALISRSRSSGA